MAPWVARASDDNLGFPVDSNVRGIALNGTVLSLHVRGSSWQQALDGSIAPPRSHGLRDALFSAFTPTRIVGDVQHGVNGLTPFLHNLCYLQQFLVHNLHG